MRYLLSLAMVAMLGCEAPHPPELCGPLDDVSLFIGEKTELQVCFYDLEQSTLDYEAVSSDPSVAAVVLVPPASDAPTFSTLLVNPISVGETTITLTATNYANESVSGDFLVTVPNRDPEYCGEPITILVMESDEVIEIPVCFRDQDQHALEITAVSSTSAVTALVEDTVVKVTATGRFEADVTVTATDEEGGVAETSFSVDVPNHPPFFCRQLPSSISVDLNETRSYEICLEDRNGDVLTDSLTVSSRGGEVEAVINADQTSLSITGVTKGEVVLRYWATDPYGESAFALISVLVTEGEELFSDSFDSRSSAWKTSLAPGGHSEQGSFRVEDGVLKAQFAAAGMQTRGGARLETNAEFWRFTVRTRAFATEALAWIELWGAEDREAYQVFMNPLLGVMLTSCTRTVGDFGPFCQWHRRVTRQLTGPDHIAVGEWYEFDISVKSGEVIFLMNGTEVHRIRDERFFREGLIRVQLQGGYMDYLEPGESVRPVEFDDVTLNGKRAN